MGNSAGSNLMAVFLAAFIMGCSARNPEPEATITDETRQAFTLKMQEVGKTLKIPAELLPYEKAEISARVQAFVQKINVDIGDRVKTGSILAILDAPESAARYAEAAAKVQETKARYLGSQDKYNRLNEASKSEGVIATGEWFTAKNQMLADSALLVSVMAMAQIYKQLQDYLIIRAPFSGIITKRSVDPGDLVGNGSGNNVLFILENTDRLRLKVPVPETYVNSVPSGRQLTFSSDAVINRTFEAELSRKSGSIDPTTRTEIWEYTFDNHAGSHKPGMYTVAQLTLNRAAASFVVPFTAVVTTLERKFVVRIQNGQAEWVDVRPGISLNEGIEIFGDLNEGDILLTRGSEEIKPESPVKVNVEKE